MRLGHVGMAGELGHITVSPNGNPCGCGNRGCVEKHASATAITAMARLLGLGDLTAADVFNLATQGNERAREIFRVMGEALGIALASLINIFREYGEDLGYPRPSSGDLSPWTERGIMLLNRVLTVQPGNPGSPG